VIGERDIVQIIIVIIGIEGTPAAVGALQTFDPFAAPARSRSCTLILGHRSLAYARSIAIATTAVSSTSG